jgi:hypothetical protein
MNYLKILTSKPHNLHYLSRYCKFIKLCINKNLKTTEKLVSHHICPKAYDLFPEYANFNKFSWNRARLTARQHYIAHHLLWKAFNGSQTSAFYAMNNKNKNITIPSKTYERLMNEASKRSSNLNVGYAVYVDSSGNKIRCKNTDLRVLSGELTSTSSGRKYASRTIESRQRTSKSVTGKNTGPMSVDERINRRKKPTCSELYYDPTTNKFVSIDPLIKPSTFIKVFTGSKKVWDNSGKFRNISSKIPIPPGYHDANPVKILKGINLDNMNYIEVNGLNKPINFYKLNPCKTGKILVFCTTLDKKVYLPKEWVSSFGLPSNCDDNLTVHF